MTQAILASAASDSRRIAQWRTLRRKIRAKAGAERGGRLLRSIDEEIRALSPAILKASKKEWNLANCQELAVPLGVLIAAWLNAEPTNPAWPGRDRLFLARTCDLPAACSALALTGFFSPERAADMLDAALSGDTEREIPGLEAMAATIEEKAEMAWNSALESGRSKKRWREFFAPEAEMDWAESTWRNDLSLWRTCIVADADAEEMTDFRDRAEQTAETPAGLAAILVASKGFAATTAQEWRDAGWDAVVVDSSDASGLYRALHSPTGIFPLAVVVDAALGVTAASGRFIAKPPADKLLGEMSDEQFNAIIGESLSFSV